MYVFAVFALFWLWLIYLFGRQSKWRGVLAIITNVGKIGWPGKNKNKIRDADVIKGMEEDVE